MYALVREASYRVLGKRHYDVQLIAATALFEEKLLNKNGGEKLFCRSSTLPSCLTGGGVHLVTVNDYLARRDAGWNAQFSSFRMSTASIIQETKSFIYDPKFNDTSHGDERLSHLKPADARKPIKPIFSTEQITNLDLIICATIWFLHSPKWSKGVITLQ